MEKTISDVNKTCIYQAGERIEFEKCSDQIVARALPEKIDDLSLFHKMRFHLHPHVRMLEMKNWKS